MDGLAAGVGFGQAFCAARINYCDFLPILYDTGRLCLSVLRFNATRARVFVYRLLNADMTLDIYPPVNWRGRKRLRAEQARGDAA